jgi:hypothetical protein
MIIEILTLCDNATLDNNGKLNIVGAFDSIFPKQVPIKFSCFLAIRIRFSKIDTDDKKLRVSLINVDGKAISIPVLGTPMKIMGIQSTPVGYFVEKIEPLEINLFGDHQIDVSVNGQLLGSIPFYVIQK